MPYKWAFLLLLVSASPRRLIIDGERTDINAYPYSVALMYCKKAGPGKNMACASFCSGSLIAKNVVLTAGHCVYDPQLSWHEKDSPPVPLDHMFVLLGTADWRGLDSASGARLVRVSSVSNAGYGRNHRYPLDDDVGLAFLSECVDLIPDRIETVKVSPEWIKSCTEVVSVGFGRHANVPADVFVHDGRLRVLEGDTVHEYSVCKAAFSEAFSRDMQAETTEGVDSELVIDKHMCAGGDTMGSTCFGDSGGPVLAADAIVGITSFGPLGVCMTSPDYIARISSYADWIRIEMEEKKKPICPGTNVSDSFTFRPPPSAISTRCASRNEWQCKNSGECIAGSGLCDGIINCKDGSDEDSYFCHFDPLDQAGDPDENVYLTISGAEAELDELIDQSLEKEAPIVSATGSGSNSGPISVTIVGILQTVDRRVRTLAQPRRSEGCGTSEFEKSVSDKITRCSRALQNVAERVDVERKLSNRVETDPSQLEAVCLSLKQCLGFPSEEFTEWYSELLACAGEVESLKSQGSYLTLCGHRLEEFIAVNGTRIEYADSFSQRFGQPQCTEFSAIAERNGWHPHTTTAMYIVLLVFLINV